MDASVDGRTPNGCGVTEVKTRVVRYWDQRAAEFLHGVQVQHGPVYYWRQVAGNLTESAALRAAEDLAKLETMPDDYQVIDVLKVFG